MKAPVPSERLFQNLQLLVIARTGYFTNAGLAPSLLSTSMLFIKESNRIPVAKSVLPLIFNDNNRTMMSKAIDMQGEDWEQPELDKPIWTYFRKLGVFPPKNQQIDDLLQLDYSKLLEGLDVPNIAGVTLFWGGLTDFLINSWSILEEFRLASPLVTKMERKATELAQQPRDPRFTRLISWTDMQFEHHMLNAVFRLRAGWDKLADYLIVPYYGVPNISKMSWPKRLNRLNKALSDQLNPKQKRFWENILENARMIAGQGGLRDARDFELHKIALRSRETLGDKQSAPSLKQLESFAVIEHHRLQDSFLLFLSLILSGPRASEVAVSGR
jgi:hypothetical protein